MNTWTNSKRKNAKQRRVMALAILLAALITIGATFAWLTSTDEVTNKLTASADYGVVVSEDFTPPSNFVPGVSVDKKVSVVNTGSIGAFVNVSLDDTTMDLTVEKQADVEKFANMILVTTASQSTSQTTQTTLVTLSNEERIAI